jgi:hypothetical protein
VESIVNVVIGNTGALRTGLEREKAGKGSEKMVVSPRHSGIVFGRYLFVCIYVAKCNVRGPDRRVGFPLWLRGKEDGKLLMLSSSLLRTRLEDFPHHPLCN